MSNNTGSTRYAIPDALHGAQILTRRNGGAPYIECTLRLPTPDGELVVEDCVLLGCSPDGGAAVVYPNGEAPARTIHAHNVWIDEIDYAECVTAYAEHTAEVRRAREFAFSSKPVQERIAITNARIRALANKLKFAEQTSWYANQVRCSLTRARKLLAALEAEQQGANSTEEAA